MPEGPEVKLSADVIRPLIINKTVTNALPSLSGRYYSENPDGFSDFWKHIQNPCEVKEVGVRGKFMWWTFSGDYHMFSTYGMTGQWSPKRGKHPCFIFQFGNEEMVFNDPRHFGTIKFVQGQDKLTKKLSELGWDPLAMPLDKNLNWIKAQLSRTSSPIAEVLMDQSVFAGVGNYIRAEALYSCKLSPWRPSNRLSQDEINTLCKSIVDVMQESYNHQGATIQTYKTVYGEEGRYSTLFKVYGRQKDPLGNNIATKKTKDKRTIYWCPTVQV